jgi:hypothetical protein
MRAAARAAASVCVRLVLNSKTVSLGEKAECDVYPRNCQAAGSFGQAATNSYKRSCDRIGAPSLDCDSDRA